MSSGSIVEIIGAVVDVEFPRGDVQKIYDALIVDKVGLTLEVQGQLGDGIVRTIAMGSTEGLKRGVAVSNTEQAIQVPVKFLLMVGRLPAHGYKVRHRKYKTYRNHFVWE